MRLRLSQPRLAGDWAGAELGNRGLNFSITPLNLDLTQVAKSIDPKIVEIAKRIESESNPIDMLKRYLDDIFMVYTGSIKSLHTLLDQLNTVHPTIKFTVKNQNHSFFQEIASKKV